MDPKNVKIVTGKEFPCHRATLNAHHKINLQRAYPFIVPHSGERVEGLLITDIDEESLKQMDKYEDEGKLYYRQQISIEVDGNDVEAFTYVGNVDRIWQHFDFDMEINERIKHFIEHEMESFIEMQLSGQKQSTDKAHERKFLPFESRAKKECIGRTVKELIQARIKNPDVSTFMTKYGLEKAVVPSLKWIKNDTEVTPYVDSYIKLITRQIVFNQIEDRIREDFPAKTAAKYLYYEHAVSALISFSFINNEYTALLMMMKSLGLDTYKPDFDYHDYIMGAIFIADELYSKKKLRPFVESICNNFQETSTPLGTELEFSTIGYIAAAAKKGQDPIYDSFYYFNKFDLHRRFWKLGAHIDNHGFITDLDKPTRGFFEIALGRDKILEDISVPVTQDPWLLAQLLSNAVKFIDIKPHSMHLSLQIPKEQPFNPVKDPSNLICLLMLGGDIQKDENGKLRERRIFNKEISNIHTGLSFSRLNCHKPDEMDENTSQVVEFQFPRLYYDHNYEPLIVALKGYQLGNNPYVLDLSKDSPNLAQNKEIETYITKWAQKPKTISQKDISNFLKEVDTGLLNESAQGKGHSRQYIEKMISEIEKTLNEVNAYIKENT